MVDDLLIVVTDTEGFRVTHAIGGRGRDAATLARLVAGAIRASSVEVWLGENRLFALDNASAIPLAA